MLSQPHPYLEGENMVNRFNSEMLSVKNYGGCLNTGD